MIPNRYLIKTLRDMHMGALRTVIKRYYLHIGTLSSVINCYYMHIGTLTAIIKPQCIRMGTLTAVIEGYDIHIVAVKASCNRGSLQFHSHIHPGEGVAAASSQKSCALNIERITL